MTPEIARALGVLARWTSPRAGAWRDELPPPDHTPERAREVADDVLARREYQWRDDRSLFDRIGEWISDQLERLVSPLGLGAGGVPVWVGWLVLALLAALAALLIYRARSGWRRDRRVPAGAGGDRIVVSAGDESIDWAAEVRRCEAAGLWRDALRARYRVLVGELARRDLIGDLVGRTTGELVADVAASAPRVAPSFRDATRLFEEAWYGGEPVGPADRDRFAALADAVRTAAGEAGSRRASLAGAGPSDAPPAVPA